jgi:hypothetical protein
MHIDEMAKQTPQQYLNSLIETRNTRLKDDFHDTKRIGSFFWFDKLLSDCVSGCCPAGYFGSSLIYPLADISIDGYVMQKAYFLWEKDNEAKKLSDEERYFIADNHIKAVFNCTIPPALDAETFKLDTKELSSTESNPTAYFGSRNRKAFWAYMRNGLTDAYDNYCAATAFINFVHSISNNGPHTQQDFQTMRQFLQVNSHIANGIDLFRLCFIRKSICTMEIGLT